MDVDRRSRVSSGQSGRLARLARLPLPAPPDALRVGPLRPGAFPSPRHSIADAAGLGAAFGVCLLTGLYSHLLQHQPARHRRDRLGPAAARRGDEAAFRALVLELTPVLTRLARGLVASDAASSTPPSLALPRRQREVVHARDVVGLSAAEAAAVLGFSPGNQRVLLHRGRSTVRRMLALTAERRAEPVEVSDELVRALTLRYRAR